MITSEKLVSIVRSWIATPYHHRARLKGIGVDCGQLIIAAHVEAGLVANFNTGFYTSDWHLHRHENKYLEFVEQHLGRFDDVEASVDQRMIDDPSFELPAGVVIVFQVGRTYSHGAMVTQWPFIVHAYQPSRIVEEVSILNTPMSRKKALTYVHPELAL